MSDQTDIRHLIIPIVISGFGITSIFVPMTNYSVATVSRENMADATGLTSLLRNLGGSVGISLLTTFIARSSQTHQALLAGHLSPYETAYTTRLNALANAFGGATNPDATHRAQGVLYGILQSHSALLAYVDQFRFLVIVCLICAPLVFLFKAPASNNAPVPMGH